MVKTLHQTQAQRTESIFIKQLLKEKNRTIKSKKKCRLSFHFVPAY